MSAQGHTRYADALARLAGDLQDERIIAIARRTAAPVTVAVLGRAGVGRGCVARGLAAAGVQVREPPGDIDVHVVAEVIKPEDRAAICTSRPSLVVLNKADLSGLGRGGPMAVARIRSAHYAQLTGVPVVPTAAHLAVCELDEELLAGLRVLAHAVSAPAPERLLDTLDYFGVAHGVRALHTAPDADAATVTEVLRRHSGVDDVVEAIGGIASKVHYERIRAAGAALTAVAAVEPTLAPQIRDFLTADDTVLARAAAARRVKEARGPLHRACAADIVRGSLRAWRQAEQDA